MSDKDDTLYLDHIAEHTAGGRDNFVAPGITQDAALRRMHTLAEPAQRLSTLLKSP